MLREVGRGMREFSPGPVGGDTASLVPAEHGRPPQACAEVHTRPQSSTQPPRTLNLRRTDPPDPLRTLSARPKPDPSQPRPNSNRPDAPKRRAARSQACPGVRAPRPAAGGRETARPQAFLCARPRNAMKTHANAAWRFGADAAGATAAGAPGCMGGGWRVLEGGSRRGRRGGAQRGRRGWATRSTVQAGFCAEAARMARVCARKVVGARRAVWEGGRESGTRGVGRTGVLSGQPPPTTWAWPKPFLCTLTQCEAMEHVEGSQRGFRERNIASVGRDGELWGAIFCENRENAIKTRKMALFISARRRLKLRTYMLCGAREWNMSFWRDGAAAASREERAAERGWVGVPVECATSTRLDSARRALKLRGSVRAG